MKRFWWNEKREMIFWDRGLFADVTRSDESGLFETDYRGSEPREIQSAEYNPETGRIKLVPKEPVKPRKVMTEIELPKEGRGRVHVYGFYGDGSYKAVRSENGERLASEFSLACGEYGNISAADQHPASPYTREAVDELLDAMKVACWWFLSEKCELDWDGNQQVWKAVQTLLRQRDSGKAGA